MSRRMASTRRAAAPSAKHIGARDLGYNLTVLPPGKMQCPFHSHHGEEEMFFILEGEGELRFGDERYPLRRNDVIACPTGGAEVAHQIVNTGTTPMRYLAISTVADLDACEYPDSGKVSVKASRQASAGSARCSAPRPRSTTMIGRRAEPTAELPLALAGVALWALAL